jgi:hypothetical protein
MMIAQKGIEAVSLGIGHNFFDLLGVCDLVKKNRSVGLIANLS